MFVGYLINIVKLIYKAIVFVCSHMHTPVVISLRFLNPGSANPGILSPHMSARVTVGGVLCRDFKLRYNE